MISKKKITPREAAYLACLSFEQEGRYLSEFLNDWSKENEPSHQDFRLAQEIAYGTCRMRLSLEYFAKQLSNGKLILKRKEKILLLSALYQFYFLDKIPLYALTNESIEIAKKYCHSYFIKFLNSILRKLSIENLSLPSDNSIKNLSIKYSYPEYYIKSLYNEYNHEQVLKILETGNVRPIFMARKREKDSIFPEIVYPEINEIKILTDSNSYYIQNKTPALLIKYLSEDFSIPNKILDLCSSPGGKLIACHDLFPYAELTANDVSDAKIKILEENLQKYGIQATLYCDRGENFPLNNTYDLVILDVPCSNTGVLNKRPEARWRLSNEHIQEIIESQIKLLRHAKKLLSPKGQIWYMTCSILKDENEDLVKKISKELGLTLKKQMKVLPDLEGADGGYAAALEFRSI